MESSGAEPNRLVPAPFTEEILQSALEELSDGARLAVQTCLDLWRDQVRTTYKCLHFIFSRYDINFFGRNSVLANSYHSLNATPFRVELSRKCSPPSMRTSKMMPYHARAQVIRTNSSVIMQRTIHLNIFLLQSRQCRVLLISPI